VTCELNSTECDVCTLGYCHDQIDDIRSKHYELILDLKRIRIELKRAEEKLRNHEALYSDVLIEIDPQ
jgi:hypothetical protein